MISKPRVLLVGIGDFTTSFQSGRPRAVLEAAEALADVQILSLPRVSRTRVLSSELRRVISGGGTTLPDRALPVLRAYSRVVRREEARLKPDLILSTTSLSMFRRTVGTSAVWPDATIHSMFGIPDYPRLNSLSKRSILTYSEREDALLSNSSIVALPTERARAAIGARESLLLPFGPNLPTDLLAEVRRRRDARVGPGGSFLFIGVEWARKGGAIAVDALLEADRLLPGQKLNVVGTLPPSGLVDPRVSLLGKLSAARTDERELLIEAMVDATALVLPSAHDNYGAVVAEAAAIGLPVLASDSVGASEYVKKFAFGTVVDHQSPGVVSAYAEAMVRLRRMPALRQQQQLNALAASSLQLNYSIGVQRLVELAMDVRARGLTA